MNKQTRLRQIKNLSLPQLIVAPRISRVICVIPSPLHQLYNLSKINNESKCFTVHFRLDLRSSQFRTSSYHKKYTPSTFFLERKNYIRTFTTINTFLLLFFRKNTISPFLFFRAIGKKARKYEIEKPRRKAIRVLPTPSPPPRIEKIYSKRRFWWISIGREGAEGEGEKHWRAWNEKIHLSGDEPLIAICVEIGSHFSKFNHCGVGWRGVRGVIYRRNMGWG